MLIGTCSSISNWYIIFFSFSIIDKQDGVRLLWSLLKSPNTEVS